MFKKWVWIVLITVLAGTANAQERSAVGMSLSCPMLPLVADNLLTMHMSFVKEDEALVKRVAENYAQYIDSTKNLLTDREYKALEARLLVLLKDVRKGGCEDFAKLKEDQVRWQLSMEDFVRKTVSEKSYKVNPKAVLELDVKKRKRPKNTAEQNKLRRLMVDFQMANYLASDTSLEDAKQKLIKRYELLTKRMREQDEAEVYRVFLNAYASSLDPHTTYFSPDDLDDFKIQMELSLTGIGAVLTSQDGYTVIQEIVVGGPADRSGKLKPKDKIIAVAQGAGEPVDVIDMDLRDVVKMIRGKKDTTVTLTVLRQGAETERFKISIQRDQIDLKDQAAKLTWVDSKRKDRTLKLAVIELPSFYGGDGPSARDSAKDIADLIEEAKKGKADGILLDLSKNGGGILQSAVVISGYFIESGAIVGVGAGGKARAEILRDRDPRVQWDGPLVVLTSKVSASASEILAGALKDYNRAVVVGDPHTYGKGTVQQMSPLPAGLGLIKVTTAMFFIPSGDSTQSIGVGSHIVIPSALAPLDIGEKYLPHVLAPATTAKFVEAEANKAGKWTPVTPEIIASLGKKSQARVAKDKEFKGLKKKIAEAKSRKTTIRISEILKKKDTVEDEDAEDEFSTSLQQKEAAEILADLFTELP